MINRKDPNLLWLHVTQPNLQKLNKLDNKVWPHLWNSPDLSSTDYRFFKHLDNFFFAEKMLPQPAGGRKCFPEFIKSQSIEFYATGINKLFFISKNVLMVMVPILINKDVFEPSYTDLKLIIQNCNYVCTNLITFLQSFPSA